MEPIVGVDWERRELDAAVQSTHTTATAMARYFVQGIPGSAWDLDAALKAHLEAVQARRKYQERWERNQRRIQNRKAEVPLW